MKNKTVFLTGAEGFIGSHMVEALVKKNFNVKALVLYNSFKDTGWLSVLDKEILKNVEIIFGDIRDKGSFKKVINKVDYIINLAALIGIPYSYLASKNYVDVNISGVHNLLELARNSNIDRFIQTSTSEVYGTAQFIPMSENHPINPQSPYAATKASADHLCMSYYYSFGLPLTILRPFNTYGPRQSTRAVIPTIINQISKKVPKVMLGSINTTRDFNYVEDTVQAYLKSLNNSKKINGQIINVGSNFEVSIKDIYNIVCRYYERYPKIEIDRKRFRPSKSEVKRLYASNKKAIKLLKWKPKFSGKKNFYKGIYKTCEWFENNKKNSSYKSTDYSI
jgi:NAD dependent epimerase/dehydratase